MLVHAVYIWLRDDVPVRDRQAHLDDLRALARIASVRAFHLGRPAASDRPVIERGYTYALVTVFDDLAGLDAYRAHPWHQTVNDAAGRYWKAQVVYDSTDDAIG